MNMLLAPHAICIAIHKDTPIMSRALSCKSGVRSVVRLTYKTLALSIIVASALIGSEAWADSPVVTHIAYDAANNVTSVIDPRGLTTTYLYDGIGQIWQQNSPDTGITSYTYDSYGRRTGLTRADGSQTTFAYDTINRIISVSAGGLNQSVVYDDCTNGIGRLCSSSDVTGSTTYTYTPEGWVSGRGFSVNGTVYSLGYSYDAEGNLAAINYPDGNKATYNYTNGALSSVSVVVGGVVSSVASTITYRPANLAMSSWTSSNGLSNTRSFDSDGRITSIAVPAIQGLSFSYDQANRITHIVNGIDSTLSQTFTYDSMSRLSTVSSTADNEVFQYDANGNRTSQTVNGQSLTSTISSTSNQVTAIAGSSNAQYGYDALGNLTSVNSSPTFHYNAFNRMDSASGASYYVNPEGQRLYKLVSGTATYFAPDHNGSLLAETHGGQWNDYVWVNGEVIGLISNGQTYAIHDDQTGRPEMMTNSSGVVVWSAQNFAFTRNVTTSSGPTLNVGFPGQYFDTETGNWNNGFRDYYGGLGRYVESDPYGLTGGASTYAYANDNPLIYADPKGLCASTQDPTAQTQTQTQMARCGNGGSESCDINMGDVASTAVGGAVAVLTIANGELTVPAMFFGAAASVAAGKMTVDPNQAFPYYSIPNKE